jgi:hypothetical protein
MELIKLDDPRLDESVAFLFAFKKGDRIVIADNPALRGAIRVPKPAAASIAPRGKTVYEITFADDSVSIVDETEIKIDTASDPGRQG